MILKLIRTSMTPTATYGMLLDYDGNPICMTLENPWKGNERNVSCIPGNTIYQWGNVDSPRFGMTIGVEDVPGRSHILFHKGNRPTDTRGCILTVTSFDVIQNNIVGVQSATAFDTLFERLGSHQMGHLEIVDPS